MEIMRQWSIDEVRQYIVSSIQAEMWQGSLQKVLPMSTAAAVGLEHISEYQGNCLNKTYYCDICHAVGSPLKMFIHIIGTTHRLKYLFPNSTVIGRYIPVSLCKKVNERAVQYVEQYGQLVDQIKVFDNLGRQILPEIHEAPLITETQNPMNLNAMNNTRDTDHHLKQAISSVPQCSYNERHVQQLSESNDTTNFQGQSDQGKGNSMISEEYSDGRSILVNTTTPNITIHEEICENPEITNCLAQVDNEDAESVIMISSSSSSNVSLTDDMAEHESDQTINYNFSNSYDVTQIDHLKNKANCIPTKMECLQIFMEYPEPLVVETEPQYEFLVSVIQTLSEVVENCNVQNLHQ